MVIWVFKNFISKSSEIKVYLSLKAKDIKYLNKKN